MQAKTPPPSMKRRLSINPKDLITRMRGSCNRYLSIPLLSSDPTADPLAPAWWIPHQINKLSGYVQPVPPAAEAETGLRIQLQYAQQPPGHQTCHAQQRQHQTLRQG